MVNGKWTDAGSRLWALGFGLWKARESSVRGRPMRGVGILKVNSSMPDSPLARQKVINCHSERIDVVS